MRPQKQEKKTTDELLRDLMIVQLGLARVPQQDIREIVGVDIHRVNRIVRHFKNLKR
jgi:hypothetical protein